MIEGSFMQAVSQKKDADKFVELEQQINYDAGIINSGNISAFIHKVQSMQNKLDSRESTDNQTDKVLIGFIGGSITQGSLASHENRAYTHIVYKYLQEKFPQVQFKYLNAGIGATDSQFGAVRVYQDLLSFEPDLVIIDFSVNDENNSKFQESYEGLIRKILKWNQQLGIISLHNCFYNDGRSAEEVQSIIDKYYKVTSLSVRESIYASLCAGKFEPSLISPDNLHPNDYGHELLANLIINYLEKCFKSNCNSEADKKERSCSSKRKYGYESMPVRQKQAVQMPAGQKSAEQKQVEQILPPPITNNSCEYAFMLNNKNAVYQAQGFYPLTAEAELILASKYSLDEKHIHLCDNAWWANTAGAVLELEFTAESLAIQYMKTRIKPAPIALVYLDGGEVPIGELDANFRENWGEKFQIDTIATNLPETKHKLSIKIAETGICKSPFLLTGIILAGKQSNLHGVESNNLLKNLCK